MTQIIPGWEGVVGPFPSQYNQPHVYARDIHSGAGNCVCGSSLGDRLHVQAAPGVDVPDWLRVPALAGPADVGRAQEPTVTVRQADLASVLRYVIGADPISVVPNEVLDLLFAALKEAQEADDSGREAGGDGT